jgi:O-succinylhomoserine sulfhydrylase
MKKDYRFETRCIRTQIRRSPHKEHSTPIYETSSFVFDTAEEARAVFAEETEGYLYTRFNNPNSDEFIQKLCLLEGAEDGIATASGMAAIFVTLIALLRPGDHILSSRQIFGTTHLLFTQVLPRWGISHTYVDMKDPQDWEDKLMPTTRLVYTESPSNPGLELADLKWLGRFSSRNDLYLMVDNCFATPYLQNPAQYGADLVVHSATKFIDGQGRTVSGAVVGRKDIIREIRSVARITGPTMSAFTAWLLSKSLETLSLRMEKHCSNAFKLARYLEKHPDIAWVRYPFLPSYPQYRLAKKQMKLGGALVTFELKKNSKRNRKFIDCLQLISITPNLGDTRSTLTHPATTTHSKLSADERKECGITEGMMRLSVGLEHIDDIVADIEQALARSG